MIECPECGSTKVVNSKHEYWCRDCYFRFINKEVTT